MKTLKLLLLTVLAACGLDEADRPDPGGNCQFWRENRLDLGPPQQCLIDLADNWHVLDGWHRQYGRPDQALVGPVFLRRGLNSSVFVPMVVTVSDEDGLCVVVDCLTATTPAE